MVVGCISESTRLDQEWCSKFIHSVETAVAVGSEYQVMLHFLASALEAWLRWFNFVSGSNFIFNYFIIIFLFLTQHTLPFPQTEANKTETENKLKGPCKNVPVIFHQFSNLTKHTKFLPVTFFGTETYC